MLAQTDDRRDRNQGSIGLQKELAAATDRNVNS